MNRSRRKLAALILTLTLWPCAGLPQGRRAARVDVLFPTAKDDATIRILSAFKRRLADLGWREDSNILYTVRYAESNTANYEPLAAQTLAARPDLVFVTYAPFAAVVRKHASGIPIVFLVSQDPVAEGLVASLAKPGGNATGVSTRSRELVGKRLQLMKEVVPSLGTIGVVRLVGLPTLRDVLPLVEELNAAAGQLGLKLIEVDYDHSKGGALARAFARLVAEKVDAVATVLDWNYPHHSEFVLHALRARLPTICDAVEFVDAGGLMSVAASYAERGAKSAEYVDRILRGARPADLPVEEPTTFELTINLKTADALGLSIPQSVLLRANRVIR